MPNTDEYQYIIETLKAKDQDKQKYYIYPVTKESAITDKNGVCLEDKLIDILERISKIETFFKDKPIPEDTNAGLYDENNNLIASWDTLINTYNLDIQKDYLDTNDDNSYSTSKTSPFYVFHRAYPELEAGVKLVIGNDITSIGDSAFMGCNLSNLKNIIIPNSVTKIGNLCFYGNTNLNRITIGENVIEIGVRAFFDCENITEIHIPNSVTHIGEAAFSVCKNLTEIHIPDSVTNIDNLVFSGDSNLTYAYISKNVIKIPSRLFSNCHNLETVIMSDQITTIKSEAFINNYSLTNITIPNSVTTIESAAFAYCTRLNVTIPDTITHMPSNTFSGVGHIKYNGPLELLYYNAKNGYEENNFIYEDNTKKKLLAYTALDSTIAIPSTVTSIGNNVFDHHPNLSKIIIPNTVTNIGNGTFAYCNKLTSITIPDSVINLGNGAFEECENLISVTLPKNITSLSSTFFNCKKLTSVTLPSGITELYGTFSGCESLTMIHLPNTISYLRSSFSGCKSLTSITIPSSVTKIYDKAFYNCDNLANVYFQGTTVPDFEEKCFYKTKGVITTFYFKNQSVYNAFTTDYYNPNFTTKSTNYNWN